VRRDADVPPPVPLCEVLYGHFREYMAICHEISDLERSRGWAEAKVWTPTVGMGDEAVIIAESPTLTGFEEERKAQYADPDYMKLVRAPVSCVGRAASMMNSSKRPLSRPE
jgi:hypothetical protein